METNQHIFPVLPQYEHLNLDELVDCLNHKSPQVRAGALAALGNSHWEQGLAPIVKAIKDAENRNTPWFGFVTVSWVGVVALLKTGDPTAQKLAREIVQEWGIEERAHLISWLKGFPAYAQALAS
ncbi:HEAT repeat domain-containing protein [Hymenobacter negativus]|uniref:HEAT repeat domain-containing protein n=1 Tax=Hymenobacter negativus TaxID=2795026 RepID=A0ABS3QHB2_9BACT|nr:hypothetical protein [Hymenobacter negativus]MBO2010368.1 hypothetical protein [Hymenobacter negativus]